MGGPNDCQHFIPLPRNELIDLLCADRTLTDPDREVFRQVCHLVTTAFHLDHHRRLLELKQAYSRFDPDTDSQSVIPLLAEQRQARLNALYREFARLLENAHFKHLARDDIEPTLDAASDWGIRMDVDFSAFEHIAIFARGDTFQKRTRKLWWKLYKVEEIEAPIYRRLVIILKLRPHPRLSGPIDHDSVFLKIFKDIPKLDVMMLLPGARVKLTRVDRSKIGFPLISGIAMAVYNFFQEIIERIQEALMSPHTMWVLAAGGIGYGYKSYYGYQQTKQRYHLSLTQSLYFQNLDSNAGVLTRLIDEAEEQDCLTTLLAYFCLWQYAGEEGFDATNLEDSIGLYLDRYADLSVICRPGEALAKLRKLHLVEDNGPRSRAVPPARAIEVLQAYLSEHQAAFPRESE
jgi:hypothetical protein